MPNPTTNAAKPLQERHFILWLLVATASLGSIAVANGYPLVFPDTGTYLRQGLRFEGVYDRPPYYSLFLLPLHAGVSLWAIPFVQDLLVCYIAFRSLALAFPGLPARRRALVVAVATLSTSLPWFSNQIMPDIFTPLIVLLVFCLCLGWSRLPRFDRIALPLALLAMVACHNANPLFTCVVGSAGIALAWLRDRSWRALGPCAALVAVPVCVALAAQILYGYLMIHRVTPSPSAPFFLLARMIDGGNAQRYLAGSCPGSGYVLCDYIDAFPRDMDEFLWDPHSPLTALLAARGREGALDEAAAIVRGTVARYPGAVLAHAVAGGLRQFVTFATRDANCPCLAGKIDKVMHELFEPEYAAYANSRQNRGTIPWHALTVIDDLALLAATASILFVAVGDRPHFRGDSRRLLGLIVVGLVSNAALMGALSSPTERYQGRIVWLVPVFAAALLLSRQRGVAPATSAAG